MLWLLSKELEASGSEGQRDSRNHIRSVRHTSSVLFVRHFTDSQQHIHTKYDASPKCPCCWAWLSSSLRSWLAAQGLHSLVRFVALYNFTSSVACECGDQGAAREAWSGRKLQESWRTTDVIDCGFYAVPPFCCRVALPAVAASGNRSQAETDGL